MLEVKNLSVTYGFHRALEAVSVTIARGEICVILGANGAGKSSLLKAIAGMERADPGSEIVMNGQPIAKLKPHRIVEAGIALVPEGRGIFGDLTVAENLQLGAFAHRARGEEAATLRRIFELFPRLAERKGQIARTMSGGEQQMVAIGRALMSKPEILMLDEPSLGLSPILTIELFRSLADVAKTGVGILLVEQNAKQSLKIAERGYLVENGHVVGEGSAAALANDPAVISAYLGGGGANAPAKPKITLPPPLRLPGSLAAIGRSAGALGARADDIQKAFIRAKRRGEALPSAFVGRYDPKAGTDPWEEIAMTPQHPAAPPATPRVGVEARRLAGNTDAMVRRATERLADHIRSMRLSAQRPSAFAAAPQGQPMASAPAASPAARPLGIEFPADLARRASERMSAHIARMRASATLPSAFAPAQPQHHQETAQPVRHTGQHGQIGHNSAAFGVETDPESEPAAPVIDSASGLSIADIVARATAIHAAHVARQRNSASAFPSAEERQRLTAFKMPALKPTPYEDQDNPAPTGQDNDKET